MNLDNAELNKNRKPTLGVMAHAGDFLLKLAEAAQKKGLEVRRWEEWHMVMKGREDKREREIEMLGEEKCVGVEGEFLNPMHLLRKVEGVMDEEKAVMVADGGDFVATASYIVRPRGLYLGETER